MDEDKTDSIDVKQQPISRENSPFAQSSPPPTSRHTSPIPSEPRTPIASEVELPCSQESARTESTAPIPEPVTPTKVDEEESPTDEIITPLIPDVPSQNTPGSVSRRKKRKSRRGKGLDVVSTNVNTIPPSPPLKLTHANKHWFDVFHTKQPTQSIASSGTDPPEPKNEIDYIQEISKRSIAWILLPLRWILHCIAIYLLPVFIALGVLILVMYVVFPRYVFSIISFVPTVVTTTTSVLAFPIRIMAVKPTVVWCSYVGIGCMRNNEGEEVVRNATYATDVEVRNAFTVIHNLNYLNNSSNRLVLDSV